MKDFSPALRLLPALRKRLRTQYGLGPAATVSLNRPCTNRPFKCPKCDLYVWTYSLGKHFQLKHAGADVPAEALLGTHEEEWVKLVGTGKRPKKCTIDGCACKA